MLIGYCFWPGVRQVISATMTRTQGIRPSICQMELLPQIAEGIAEYGSLTWVFGDFRSTLTNCKVDKGSFRYDSSGMVVSLSILDRRWKWQFSQPVSAVYNRRVPNVGVAGSTLGVFGSIDAALAAAPQDVAKALLDAMGETGYDVSQLPNDSRPELLYDWDHSAEKLNDLAESLGCRVVLRLGDTAAVVRQGVGADLPAGDEMRVQAVLDPPEIPDSITVVGGKSQYQVDLPLVAVGQDVNGVILPIQTLSYTPPGGWGAQGDPGEWKAVPGWQVFSLSIPPALLKVQTLGWVNPNILARDWVYKAYRVAMTDLSQPINAALTPMVGGWQGVPGTRLTGLYQILPLLTHQVAGWQDPLNNNTFTPFDAWVYGEYYTYGMAGIQGAAILKEDDYGNCPPGSLCFFDFQLDVERGIVQFSTPIYLINPVAGLPTVQGNLYLRVAVNVKSAEHEAPSRYSLTRQTGLSNGTGPRLVRRDEIVYLAMPQYDANYNVTGVTDNKAEVEREANYAIDAVMQEYFPQTPNDVTYMGLKAIDCDGAVMQVTWSVGPGGATTRASRGTEWHPSLPSYREKALIQDMAAKSVVVQLLQDQSRRL